ncbi:nuclear transport factor 2 family protein [Companilactobacillus baiquanensis]|uniref:Nuclear transport factor 2 family protein n=1 Tax=Companilactobacillus baiquanensis TaxID=2486005 RepID=A0ABW1UUK7_9LACO|nr:nuclear transport factor 2 family protein [Companilactobacillus baiquanensis]
MTDKEKIIALYRAENTAMVSKDINKLNEILKSTMKLTHMTGYVQSKFEWIDQIQNEEMKYYSSIEDNLKDIQIHDDKASLIGQNQVRASIWGGGVNTWPLEMKMYFVKQDGQWVIDKQVASTY